MSKDAEKPESSNGGRYALAFVLGVASSLVANFIFVYFDLEDSSFAPSAVFLSCAMIVVGFLGLVGLGRLGPVGDAAPVRSSRPIEEILFGLALGPLIVGGASLIADPWGVVEIAGQALWFQRFEAPLALLLALAGAGLVAGRVSMWTLWTVLASLSVSAAGLSNLVTENPYVLIWSAINYFVVAVSGGFVARALGSAPSRSFYRWLGTHRS